MWILFALTSATILASRKIQEKYLVGHAGNSLGWMIRLGSALSILILWLIFSRNIEGITHPVVWGIIALISVVIYPIYTLGYYHAVKHLPLSYFGMLGIIAPVANAVFAYFFFDTIPTISGYIGIMAVLIGLTILLYKNEHTEIPL
jgi:drug/metabolite transporter (DMT)-like permease